MLRFINITNFAVIQRLGFDFHAGLNLLTGETGAGKSIIVDALGLLLGGRSPSNVVRTGERAALIEGLFDLTGENEQKVGAILHEVGIAKESEADLLIRREVHAGGRSRLFINDQSVTTSTLKSLQPYLIEIHGQGEQQALTSTRAQLEMLDNFAGSEGLRQTVGGAYLRWKSAVEALRALDRDEATRERAADMLRVQIEEIERASPVPGEDEELSARRTLLAHAEKALGLSADAYAALYESDQSAVALIAHGRRKLQDLSAIDPRVATLLNGLEAAQVSLTDIAEALRGYGAGVDFSPERLNEVENRLSELERLKRKHGRDLQGLLEVRDDLKRQLEHLGKMAEREGELLREVEESARAYEPLAKELTNVRLSALGRLEQRVREELRDVALENACFVISVETSQPLPTGKLFERQPQSLSAAAANTPCNSFWSPYGADRVEFNFSANVGESARPLSRVASGGELSRLMLTLRTVCRGARSSISEEPRGATLVFDEIDSGIGGRVAEAVGRRLKRLAGAQQVLCVTHQPQLARFADHHYVVSKQVEKGRTLVSVRELDREGRVGELSRMIGGAEDVSAARATARWMLENLDKDGTADVSFQSGDAQMRGKGVSQRRMRTGRKAKGSRLTQENSATLDGRK